MRATQPPPGNGVSPLVSLRADLAGRPATRHDDDAIVVAVLLRHSAMRPGTSAARRSLSAARRVALRAMTADELRQGAGFDERGGRLPFRPLRTFVDRTMRMAGDAWLANNMLDSLAALIPLRSREGGLLLAQRAATSWYLGENELSVQRYRQLIRLGRALDLPELIGRGMHGVAVARMSAGNMPEAERLLRRALRFSGTAFPRLSGQSAMKLAIMHTVRGEFDEALEFAWRAYELAKSFELDRRAVLGNLAQLLYDAGYAEASRAAAAHVLRLPVTASHRFPLLGTYARASAAIGDARAVDRAASRVSALAKGTTFPQQVADALLDCSFALDEAGRPDRAARFRAQAQAIAQRHGYHEIAYLAEHRMPRGRPRTRERSSTATLAIVNEVQALDPGTLTLAEIHAG